MFPKKMTLITTGIFVVSLLVALGFIGILSWVIVGVLCPIVIGVFSWLISLVSRIRETQKSIGDRVVGKKTTNKRWVVNKEIVLKGENYETFSVDLEKGEHLLGEVSSEEAINVFLVNKYGLRKFENQEDFSYEDCGSGEGIKRTRIDFTPSKSGRWFLVVENEADEDTSVEIRLFVASPQFSFSGKRYYLRSCRERLNAVDVGSPLFSLYVGYNNYPLTSHYSMGLINTLNTTSIYEPNQPSNHESQCLFMCIRTKCQELVKKKFEFKHPHWCPLLNEWGHTVVWFCRFLKQRGSWYGVSRSYLLITPCLECYIKLKSASEHLSFRLKTSHKGY